LLRLVLNNNVIQKPSFAKLWQNSSLTIPMP